MEVTTVSPSPASPTEGDNLCEIDVTTVAIHSVSLIICLCGLAGNGAVIGLLSLISRNSGIFKLAVADFLLLLLTVLSALLFLVEDVSCSPILPLLYLNFLFQLSVISYYWTLFRLMPDTAVLYMGKLCKLCCHRDLSERLRWVVDSVQYWAFFALFTVIPAVTLLCPSNEQEHCRAALISTYTVILLLFVAPVVISRTVDFIKAKLGSQQGQKLKRRDIVIVLTALLTLLLSLWNFLQQLGHIVVSSQVFFLLACINSSIKPFIYFLVGSWRTNNSMGSSRGHCSVVRCWRHCTVGSLRDSLQRVFEKQEEKTACSNDATRDTGL